jgi:hypothetical protein
MLDTQRSGRVLVTLTVMAVVGGPLALRTSAATEAPPFAVAMDPHYEIVPLISTGDTVQLNGAEGEYRMVGIPDGLGLKAGKTRASVYMNHELRSEIETEAFVGKPMVRGAIVDKLIVNRRGDVLSADRAFDSVYMEDELIGPAAQTDNETPAFSRFCSSLLAGKGHGFDRTIYFTNEEETGPAADATIPTTFDPLGGSTVAIFNNEAHVLPNLGHFEKENSLVMRETGRRTVIVMLEDGPNTPDSQLYMYVGRKSRADDATPLALNGLNNGKLYVFASSEEGVETEAAFTTGSIAGTWVEIPGADTMSDADLETAADAAGAFGFVKLEDGAFSPTFHNQMFFVTTGAPGESGNVYGRAYRLTLDADDPRGPATLGIVLNADDVAAAEGDTAYGPDNVEVTDDYLMIAEGGTGPSKALLLEKDRDQGIWRFPIRGRSEPRINIASGAFIVQVSTTNRAGEDIPLGTQEPSGIIDASRFFGEDSWLFVVQRFPPTLEPVPNTFRDGQLLLLRPTS